VRLLKSAVKSFFLPDKKRQIIFIDLFFLIEIVIPDEASLLAVLSDCRLA